MGLEDVERFVIDVGPFEGPVEIGQINRTVISIEDNDSKLTFYSKYFFELMSDCFTLVVNILASTQNEVVFESDGTVEICLMKSINTSRPFQVDVVVQETTTSPNQATGIYILHKSI